MNECSFFFVCVCVYTYVQYRLKHSHCISVCIHTHIHTYIHTCIHVHSEGRGFKTDAIFNFLFLYFVFIYYMKKNAV